MIQPAIAMRIELEAVVFQGHLEEIIALEKIQFLVGVVADFERCLSAVHAHLVVGEVMFGEGCCEGWA